MRSSTDEVCRQTGRPSGTASRVAMTVAVLATALAMPVRAQSGNQVPSLGEQLVGTWSVESQYTEQDGQKIQSFGANPKGILVYDDTGRFVGLVQNSQMPLFASGNRMKGTDAEYKAVAQSSIAYYGKYTVDEKAARVTMHFEGCTFPNWDGQDQTRNLSFEGKKLNMIIPVNSTNGMGHIVLARVK